MLWVHILIGVLVGTGSLAHPRVDIQMEFSTLSDLLSSPASYISPTEELRTKTLDALKGVFDLYKKFELGALEARPGCRHVDTGPLTELYTEGLDGDQIWEQLELVNKPVIKTLKGVVGNLSTKLENGEVRFLAQQKKPTRTRSKSSSLTGLRDPRLRAQDSELVHDSGERDCIDSEEKCLGGDSEEEDEDGVSGKAKAVRGRSSVVDDRFFKLSEMEKFLEMAERNEAKTVTSSNEDSESDEEGAYFRDIASGSEDESRDGQGLLYGDFFDPPGEEVGGAKTSGTRKKDGIVKNSADAVSSNQEGSGDEGLDAEDAESAEEEASEEEEEGGVTERGEEQDVAREETELSKHQKKQLVMQKKIAVLEEANLAEKSWQMGGETSAKKRPLNSLLAEDLAFDHMSRPAPLITEEATKTLEDIIKQRVLDEAWDDVERRVKPVEKPYDYSKSRPLDQEKSKISLAEVYEQEYIKQTQDAAVEEGKEDQRHTEIREMVNKLFYKLDALSNFHFTPKPPMPEVTIVANVPAIQMEEVAPITTSDTTLLAPEELQEKSRRPEVGQTEKTDTDRKRERRLKKAQKRLKESEKEQRAMVAAKLRPGLGNKYSRKSLEKRLKEREESEGVDKSLKSSSKFFAKLQEQAKDQVKSAKGSTGRRDLKQRTSVQQYKL